MFSKTCKYAIRAILFLATSMSEDRPYRANEIAQQLDVPAHFLAKVLQLLVRENLISSIKGPGGGFYLQPEQLELTLEEVVMAVDGPEVFTTCILGLPNCSDENPCPLHVHAFSFREGLRYQLAHHTVEKIAREMNFEELKI